MKFTYQYRTSDNAVHSGTISASSRDVAFNRLKSRGFKPFSLVEDTGFFNVLFGKGKRWIAICLLSVAALMLLRIILNPHSFVADSALSQPRHQIYGDPALMEEWGDTVYSTALVDRGECILAVYAQPGGYVGWRGGNATNTFFTADDVAAIELTKDVPVSIGDDDSRELRELKAILVGMKDELRNYLSDGVGTARSYLDRLEERRIAEVAVYEQVAHELADESDETVREARNESLRALGLRTVPRERK